MPTYTQPAWMDRTAATTGLAAALLGLLALVGWHAGVPILTTGLPGHPPMIPNTALAFLGAGLSVAGLHGRGRTLSYGLAALVVVLGVVTLAEWTLDTPLGIDPLLLPGHGAGAHTSHPGRISPQLAVALALFGVTRLSAQATGRWRQRASNAALIGFCAIVLAVELGYLYDARELTTGSSIGVISVPSAVGLVLLTLALLARSTHRRPLRWLFAGDLAGSVVRRLLPAAVVVPILLGAMRLWGQNADWYGTRFGMVLFTGSMIAAFVGLVCYTASVISGAEQERWMVSRQLDALFEHIPASLTLRGIDGRYLRVNDSLARRRGKTAAEMVGGRLEDFYPPDLARRFAEHDEAVARTLRPAVEVYELDGGRRHTETTRFPVFDADGDLIGVGTFAVDVTEKRAAQEQLRAAEERYRHLAEHDPLTGLWNRRRFEQELDAHLELCRAGGVRGALLSVDLDHFKVVNDTYGHHVGDELLAGLATAMSDVLAAADGIARQGGDEFLVLLRTGDEGDATRVAHTLIAAVRRTTDLLAERVGPAAAVVTASVGVVVFDQLTAGDLRAEAVLIHADHALYDAKSAGRGRPRLATPTKRLGV